MAASDLGVPAVGISLLYGQGYCHQDFDASCCHRGRCGPIRISHAAIAQLHHAQRLHQRGPDRHPLQHRQHSPRHYRHIAYWDRHQRLCPVHHLRFLACSWRNCTISITFSPTSVATFSATLSVADTATGSPQTVALSGTGNAAPNFTLSASPAVQAVPSGTAATYTLTVTPQNGAFNHAVSLSVTGLPQGATATFTPPSVTPGSSAATSQLSIQTATTTVARNQRSIWPIGGPALALIGIFFLPARRRRQWLALGTLFLAALGALTLSGCGGGFALNAPSANTYSITVSADSGQDIQTTTVQLTVN